MPELTIHTFEVVLRPEILVAVKEELQAACLENGKFSIGSVVRAPQLVYILWRCSGDTPVTMTASLEAFESVERTRATIQEFLVKWKHRAGAPPQSW